MSVDKQYDIVLADLLAELARQMVDPEDTSPGSPTMIVAVQNTLSAVVTLIYRYTDSEPSTVLGALEIAKASVLHDLHECITQQRLEDGE